MITNYPDEWERIEATPHRVGIFPVGHQSTQEFMKSLASWAHSNKNTHQCVLLLVDDLESVASLDPETVQNFRWLLLRGPARRVWPIVTLNAPRYGQVISWLQNFRTRVFGRVANARVAEALGGDQASVLSQLEARIQFSCAVAARSQQTIGCASGCRVASISMPLVLQSNCRRSRCLWRGWLHG